ncbi:Rpp20 subunit of nuclear RNase MRP and P-domain-containing protein [Aspergillus aurantiobrunneus]
MPSSKKTQPQGPDLQFERKNQDMVKLPKYARIHKRPIPHAPIASPYAGPSTPKTIYISTSTPYMSAVKRVQKLLRHAEKRATASVAAGVTAKSKNQQQKRSQGNQSQQEKLLAALARGEEREQLSGEEVFVKATGRAMKIALRVGRWFESGGREAEYKVRVSTGSVLVVDDVEEDEGVKEGILRDAGTVNGVEANSGDKAGDETTMLTATTGEGDTTIMTEKPGEPAPTTADAPSKPLSKSALRKRKRIAGLAASLAETELPETRTRWVNSVEVAVSLK